MVENLLAFFLVFFKVFQKHLKDLRVWESYSGTFQDVYNILVRIKVFKQLKWVLQHDPFVIRVAIHVTLEVFIDHHNIGINIKERSQQNQTSIWFLPLEDA